MYVVPYSDHSSYSELMEMVSQLAPHQILPIIKYWSKSGWWASLSAPDQSLKTDMTIYRHLLTAPPPDPVVIPEEVIKLMDAKAPRLFQARPRRYVLRYGLSPKRSKARGVVFTSPGSHSLPSLSLTPSSTPTSFTTRGSSRLDLHSPRRTDLKESPRSVKYDVRYPSHSVIRNELQSGHIQNERPLKRNTPMDSADSSKSARLVNEDGPMSSRSVVHKVNNEGNKEQPREHIALSARSLTMESAEKVPSNEMQIDLKRKQKAQNVSTMRRDALLKGTTEFIKEKTEEINSLMTYNKAEDLRDMVKDANLVLESLSCLHSVL